MNTSHKKQKIDIWNDCIVIRDTAPNPQDREMAKMLLGRMNTASGTEFVRKEAEAFIKSNDNLFQHSDRLPLHLKGLRISRKNGK